MQPSEKWIKKLNLSPHPEGGYYKEIYRSNEILNQGLPERYTGPRTFGTSIYYLLLSGQFSSIHRLKSDETWHFYYGSPLEIHIIHSDSSYEMIKLGNDVDKGENLQHTVHHGSWFGALPANKNSYSLVGATVSPGFDFEDFELGKREDLITLYPLHEEIIKKLTT